MGKTVEKYMLMELVGEGTFAKVYKAKHIVTGQQFAIKVISSQKFKDTPKLQQCTVNEINILSQIRNECPYIVTYVDMLKTTNNYYFVYEFCNGGTLDKMIQKDGCFPEAKANRFLRQILQAFRVLNRNNIMHRDLKPENILIHNGSIKLADFSFCKLLENKNDLTQTMLGSPIYMAPEVLKGQTYTIKADIWSMGIVYYQMLFGKCPYESKSIALLIKLLQKQDLIIPNQPKISSAAQQFLRRVLVKDYNQRATWDQIFNAYQINEQGEMVSKREQSQPPQLRSSMRNSNGNIGLYGMGLRGTMPNNNGLTIQTQMNTYGNPVNTFASPKSGFMMQSPLASNNPAYNKTIEYPSNEGIQSPQVDKNISQRKSPAKFNQQQRSTLDFRNGNVFNNSFNSLSTTNTSVTPQTQRINSQDNINHAASQQSIGGSQLMTDQQRGNPGVSNSQITGPSNRNQGNGFKTDRMGLTRIEIFTKNHLKSIQINQMVLDVFGLQQQYSNYICYFLFKNVCKQIQALYENLKKQSVNDPIYREFRVAVEAQLENIKIVTRNFYQAIIQDEKDNKILGETNLRISKNIDDQLVDNKNKILKLYVQKLNDTDQDVKLAAQIVDYLYESILIKKDAYERMSREHLYRLMRNKIAKE